MRFNKKDINKIVQNYLLSIGSCHPEHKSEKKASNFTNDTIIQM